MSLPNLIAEVFNSYEAWRSTFTFNILADLISTLIVLANGFGHEANPLHAWAIENAVWFWPVLIAAVVVGATRLAAGIWNDRRTPHLNSSLRSILWGAVILSGAIGWGRNVFMLATIGASGGIVG